MIILMLGAPGVGKGTQAARMAKEMGFVHLSTGDLLREAVAGGTPLGQEAKAYMDKGELVPDEVVIAMIVEKVKSYGPERHYLLDGFPRNLAQAEALEVILQGMGLGVDLAVDIEVPDEILVERLTARRVCRSCGHVYNTQFKPPTAEGKCDICLGELYQRSDDTVETVTNRLSVYKEQTAPLVAYYRERGVLTEVDGDVGIDNVAERIKAVVRELAAGD